MDDLIETIKDIALSNQDINYRPSKEIPGLLVENCCDNANFILTVEEWGIAWADGVRRWNKGKVIDAECGKCHKKLKFKYRR